jgi:predicted DNA-binding ribbon-helix-helix protein
MPGANAFLKNLRLSLHALSSYQGRKHFPPGSLRCLQGRKIMCKLFVQADSSLWQTTTRSLRMRGFATSVRLERLYWRVLEEIAARDGFTTNELLVRLYDELSESAGPVENYASFLRVCCGRYMQLQLEGDIPQDQSIPIRSLDADILLAREAARRSKDENRTQPDQNGNLHAVA